METMLTLNNEFFDTCHRWDITLRDNDMENIIYNYASLIKHGPTQFDMVMSFYRSWRGLCEIIATCDGVELSLEDIYTGNWRLIK